MSNNDKRCKRGEEVEDELDVDEYIETMRGVNARAETQVGAIPSSSSARFLGEHKSKRAHRSSATPTIGERNVEQRSSRSHPATIGGVMQSDQPQEQAGPQVGAVPRNNGPKMLGEQKSKRCPTDEHNTSTGVSTHAQQATAGRSSLRYRDKLAKAQGSQSSSESVNARDTGEEGVIELSTTVTPVEEHTSNTSDPPEPEYHIAVSEGTGHNQGLEAGLQTPSAPVDERHSNDGLVAARPVEEDDNILEELPQAEQWDEKNHLAQVEEARKEGNLKVLGYLGLGLLAVLVVILLVVVLPKNNNEESLTPSPSVSPSASPSAAPSTQEDYILNLLPEFSSTNIAVIGTPQHNAFQWLMNDTAVGLYSDTRLVQRYALAVIYYATEGDDWYNIVKEGWLNHDLHECSWSFTKDTELIFKDFFGQEEFIPEGPCTKTEPIALEEELYYETLWLPEANLAGSSIPLEIFLLKSLRTLNLEGNPFLSATIPTEIGMLTNLENLALSFLEHLSGTLPSEIGLCYSLTSLRIDETALTGSLPTSIGMLQNITLLVAEGSSLSGSIPSEIGLLTSLEVFYNGESMLEGAIPSEVGLLESLEQLSLFSTHLSGQIPSELGRLSQLEFISLFHNDLNGALPTTFGGLSSLLVMSVRHNTLSGAIPSEVGLLSSLWVLYLQGNSLSSSLPTEIGAMRGLESLHLFDNHLTGSVPSEVGLMNYLFEFKVNHNELTAMIPSEIGHLFDLSILHLQDNMLSGTLPKEMYTLANMEELQLQRNQLTGTLAAETDLWFFMYWLSLGGNRFSSVIPTEIGLLGDMEILSLAANEFTGTLPSEIGLMSGLAYLDVSENDLTGGVPQELAAVLSNPHLEVVNLTSNALSGELTGDFCTADQSLFRFDCTSVLCGCSCLCQNSSAPAANATNAK